MHNNVLSRVLDEGGALKEWGPLTIVIGRQRAWLLMLRFPADWRQSVVEVALEAAESGVNPRGGQETVRVLGRLWYRKMRAYGFSPKYDIEGETIGHWHKPEQALFSENVAPDVVSGERRDRPRCGVSLCGRSGIYLDPHYGRLCRRHKFLVHMRKRRGWDNPYQNIETAGTTVSDTYMPAKSKNKKMWATVRLGMTGEEWTHMWEWAKGYRKSIDEAVLEKALKLIMSQ
mgnify:CR=1 FL=1